MFLRFDKTKCPLCGTVGSDTEVKKLSNCPRCGTKFNEFGIVHAPNNEMNLHWT